ncbi:MAG: hypothetical protein Q7T71_16980 [Herbiconiux sp.]|nr:hypothetical protein [Herbiconiux sp.]
MNTAESRIYRAAVALALWWCALYTRDVDGRISEARRSELESDLFEQGRWSAESGMRPARAAALVVGRSLRGMIADLLWRRTALSETWGDHYPSWARARRVDGVAAAVGVLAAACVTAWGSFVLLRAVVAAASGEIAWGSPTFIALVAYTGAAACGTVLLLRRRTRALGAIWMVLPSAALVHLGLYQLFSLSATVGVLRNAVPLWGSAEGLTMAGIGALFLAGAIRWWPAADRARPSAGAS